MRTLLKRMKKEGDAVVLHAQPLAPGRYAEAGAGDLAAAEQLAKQHQIQVSKETLRGWMIGTKMWKLDSRKDEAVHCWRPRRSGFGELAQWDTSEHDWLETGVIVGQEKSRLGRGPSLRSCLGSERHWPVSNVRRVRLMTTTPQRRLASSESSN